MGIGRQVRLVEGARVLSLTSDPYVLQAKGGWSSAAGSVTLVVLTRATTMAEMERQVVAVQQVLARAALYESAMVGERVELWMKTCDNLTLTAELGATWRVTRVRGGRVAVELLGGLAAAPNALLTITLEVDGVWQRQLAAPVLEALTGAGSVISGSNGGLTTNNAATALWARRLRWSSSTGITLRYFWTYAAGSNHVNLGRLGGNMRCYWGHSASRFYILDNGALSAETAVMALTAGRTYEVVARWSSGTISVFVDGVRQAHTIGAVTWAANPDTYRLIETDAASGVQQFASVQAWPSALSDAEITAMAVWGRPEGELAWCIPPADDKCTNAAYRIYNGPGAAPGPLRVMLRGGSQDYGKIGLAWRMLRAPGTLRFEAESGTLGGMTASNSNAAASGGSQARFTPTATGWNTQVTVTLAANPADVAAMQGEYRLYLAGYDSAAAVQTNRVRWRLVVAGVAGEWSEARAFAAVATRSLVELGTLTLPPGNWPAETLAATTTGYGSAYVRLEVQVENSIGSGGGTLDLDALYLAPAEAEGTATGTIDVSDVDGLLDYSSTPPAFLVVQDQRSLEFGGWLSYAGDDLLLPPSAGGAAGQLMLWWYRSATEELYPNDVCDAWLFYAPRWL